MDDDGGGQIQEANDTVSVRVNTGTNNMEGGSGSPSVRSDRPAGKLMAAGSSLSDHSAPTLLLPDPGLMHGG